MRWIYFLAFFFRSFDAFSCTENLQQFPEECRTQDHFNQLQDEFKKLSINVQDLKGYKIPRALSPQQINGKKNNLLNHTKITLDNSLDWQRWKNADRFINELNVVFVSINDILKLHKNIYSGKAAHSEAGLLRINQGITNPSQLIRCEEKLLLSDALTIFENPDLKSDENYPLLEIENLKTCPDGQYYSGRLIYYKGASVRQELVRWLNDFNDMIIRYENKQSTDISPLQYIADMRRWLLAIAPFSLGNLEVADALTDYFNKRLGLPVLPLKDFTAPHLLKLDQNRAAVKKRSDETLKYIESCLYENKVKPVSSDCSIL